MPPTEVYPRYAELNTISLTHTLVNTTKVKGREAYVSLFFLMFLYAYASTIGIVDKLRVEGEMCSTMVRISNHLIKKHLMTVHFMIQRSFVIDPKYLLTVNTTTYKKFS